MPVSIAWEVFGNRNGVSDFLSFRTSIERLRARSGASDDRIGCVVLSDAVVLQPAEWVAAPNDWKRNTVTRAGYDLTSGEGRRVWDQLRGLDARVADRAISALGGYSEPALVARRRGQGAFRFMVTDAYERRCAVTGERTLPVLEAAHIRPYSERPEHDVTNGILLRSDVHRLFDLGLVTIDPDNRFRVSSSIERDYTNGKIYYALDGKSVASPRDPADRANPAALEWHSRHVFRP